MCFFFLGFLMMVLLGLGFGCSLCVYVFFFFFEGIVGGYGICGGGSVLLSLFGGFF